VAPFTFDLDQQVVLPAHVKIDAAGKLQRLAVVAGIIVRRVGMQRESLDRTPSSLRASIA